MQITQKRRRYSSEQTKSVAGPSKTSKASNNIRRYNTTIKDADNPKQIAHNYQKKAQITSSARRPLKRLILVFTGFTGFSGPPIFDTSEKLHWRHRSQRGRRQAERPTASAKHEKGTCEPRNNVPLKCSRSPTRTSRARASPHG